MEALDRDHEDEPGGATDRERVTAKRFDFDFAAQEVLFENGRARDDMGWTIASSGLRLSSTRSQSSAPGGNWPNAPSIGAKTVKGPLPFELFVHSRGLKKVQETVEPADFFAVWMMSAACTVQAPSVIGRASATALGSPA